MDQGVIIRKASLNDAENIHKVLVKSFKKYKYFYSQEGYEDTVLSEKKAKERIIEMEIYVAEDNENKIIGTIGWQKVSESEGHIRGMGVIPRNQGKKSPASSLLKKVEIEAKKRGCKILTLDTTEILKRAHKFYEKHGFKRTGKTGNFFGAIIFEYAKKI